MPDGVTGSEFSCTSQSSLGGVHSLLQTDQQILSHQVCALLYVPAVSCPSSSAGCLHLTWHGNKTTATLTSSFLVYCVSFNLVEYSLIAWLSCVNVCLHTHTHTRSGTMWLPALVCGGFRHSSEPGQHNWSITGSSGFPRSNIESSGSQYYLPSVGSKVIDCHGAVRLFNASLKGSSVCLKDYKWRRVGNQSSSHGGCHFLSVFLCLTHMMLFCLKTIYFTFLFSPLVSTSEQGGGCVMKCGVKGD